MKRRNVALSILFAILPIFVAAQNDTIYRYDDDEQILELENDDAAVNYDDEIEELHEKITEPININTVNKEQLQQFPFLSDIQIENILAYLYLHGEMQSIYELQLVKDMDWQTARYMSMFFCVKPVSKSDPYPSIKDILKYGRHEVLLRTDVPFYRTEGYLKNKYIGSPYYQSARYSFHYRDKFWAGMIAEKDKGEPLFARYNRKGFDSYSFYLLMKDMGRIKSLAVGDYRLSIGQGLIVSNNFLLGKSTYLSTLNRRGNTISKHSSTDEYNFFRGIAASITLNDRLTISTFLSYRKMDGTVNGDSLTSINETELHRTQKEADCRNAFGLFFTGANLNYINDRFQIGMTGVYYCFTKPYSPAFRKYNKYDMRGSRFYNFGTDYSYRFLRFSFSGEAAIGKRGLAVVNRLQYTPKQGYNLLLFHRYYAHNYWAYFANSFSDGSKVQNENGWFVAADIVPLRGLSLFSAVDLVSFPWWRYRVSKPSQAADVMFRCTYSPSYRLKMDLNYRYRQKERDVTGTSGEDIRQTYQHNFRYRLSYAMSHIISFRTSADYCLFEQKGFALNKGYQFTQAFIVMPVRLPLQFMAQTSYFNTDNYDCRVYIYERNLLNNFYVPSFQGQGLHFALRVQYELKDKWLIIFHGDQTRYYHQTTIGSGNDKIDKSFKTDLQLQVRLKF
jgi:hypothetical protein